MIFQTPEYNQLRDRLDFIAERAGTSTFAVGLVNPEWDGSEYIPRAIEPAGDLDYVPDLTPIAQTARDALYPISNPREYLEGLPFAAGGQMHETGRRLASLTEAAWWSARMRLLLPRGSIYGDSSMGSPWLRGALSGNVGQLADVVRYAEALLAEDNVWYGVLEIEPEIGQPLLLRLITDLQLRVL